jgi:hypothetical protein
MLMTRIKKPHMRYYYLNISGRATLKVIIKIYRQQTAILFNFVIKTSINWCLYES